ncbi:MAG: hypothetical protein LOD91_11425 [Limnochordales bacterium]
MPLWVVFLILGLFQLVIYGVLRGVAQQVSKGQPPPMLRAAVAFAGIVGLLVLGLAVYAAVAGL